MYVTPAVSEAVGSRVAVRVAALQVTAAATSAPAGVRSSNVEVEMDAGSIASLKVAVTLAVTATPVAPAAGVVPVTVGGVVSPAPAVVSNTTSTQ